MSSPWTSDSILSNSDSVNSPVELIVGGDLMGFDGEVPRTTCSGSLGDFVGVDSSVDVLKSEEEGSTSSIESDLEGEL